VIGSLSFARKKGITMQKMCVTEGRTLRTILSAYERRAQDSDKAQV
jgi:hypothetical protein